VLGKQTAQLTISGGGITTTPVTLIATSVDGFLALSANNITTSSFMANWTSSANATGYKLNVYSLAGDGSATPKTILEQDFLNGIPAGWKTEGYTEVSTASNVRFSSGPNYGKLTTPTMDLSTSATVLTVKARQYASDAGAKLMVLVNADTLAKWTTAVDYQDFTVNIPIKTSTSTISLYTYAGTGHRVYVDYVKLATQGVAQMPVSLTGYPKSVGAVLIYSVTDLKSDSTYFYTVTPEGNATILSDQITVHTLKLTSALDEHSDNLIVWSVTPDGITVRNLPENSHILVLDMMGRQIRSIQNSTSEMKFNLSQKGIYILQVKQAQHFKSYKIRF